MEEEKDFSKEMIGKSRPQRDSILFSLACSSFYFVMDSQLYWKKTKQNKKLAFSKYAIAIVSSSKRQYFVTSY